MSKTTQNSASKAPCTGCQHSWKHTKQREIEQGNWCYMFKTSEHMDAQQNWCGQFKPLEPCPKSENQAVETLLLWINEVSGMLAYQMTIPHSHKIALEKLTDIVERELRLEAQSSIAMKRRIGRILSEASLIREEWLKTQPDGIQSVVASIKRLANMSCHEVTCPKCGNYYGGHATGGQDICDCHDAKSSNDRGWTKGPDSHELYVEAMEAKSSNAELRRDAKPL